jgi:hypothetical protein
MWAMIGCCIALAVWASGLLYFTAREEKRRVLQVSNVEVDIDADVKGLGNGVVKRSSA